MSVLEDNWEEFVASLDDEYCDCESSVRYGEGPPVKPLAWPTPTLFQAELITVKACDHRSTSTRTIDNVLVKKMSGGRRPDRAYLIRKKISRTTFGSLRMGVVLQRRSEDELDAKEVPWISTEELVAVKVSSRNKIRQLQGQQLEDPLREVAALQLVGNQYPHIVGCHEVLQDAKYLYTVMPYCSQGTNLHGRLFSDPDSAQHNESHLPPPTEDEARSMFRQVLKGLLQLQRKGIFHRDISLDNLLISKTDQVRIVDLGMSLRVPYNDPCNEGCITDVSGGDVRRLIKKQGKGGRLMYLAPEIVAEKDAFDGFAVDLWAAGVILFLLCVGLAPFKTAEQNDKRYAKISSGGLKSLMETLKISVSPDALDLLQNMLWEDPRHRLSLLEVMKHPWVMGENIFDPNALANAISSEVSVESVSSTEPTQEAETETLRLIKAEPTQEAVKDNESSRVFLFDPESRQSASESGRDPSFADAVHQVNQRLARNIANLQQIGPKLKANAQQVGPRIMNNAQRIGPKLKNAVANVHIQRPRSSAANPGEQSPSTPTRQFFSKFKTVLPNKTPPRSRPTTP